MMRKIVMWCCEVEKIILGHAGFGINESEE